MFQRYRSEFLPDITRTGGILLGLLLLVPGCPTQVPLAPKVQVELHGYSSRAITDDGATPLFTDESRPTWHIEPGAIRKARLHLSGPTFKGTVAVQVEIRDGFAIARVDPIKRLGEYRAALEIDGHTQWQGKLRWLPNRYEQPLLRPIVASWDQDRTNARRSLRSLCDEGPDWMRFQTYRVWGGLEWSKTATIAGEVWTQGFEAMLREGSIESALALGGSAAFISLEAGDLDEATSLIERMKPLCEAHGNAFNRADLLHLQARLEMDREDATLALELARRSAMVAWQAGNDGMWAIATMLAGDQLLSLGRYAEALDTIKRAQPRITRARARLVAQSNLLWAELWGQEAGVWTLPEGHLERGFEGLLAKCQDPDNRAVPADLANARSCLAYLALRRNDVEAATRWLRGASSWQESELGMERWFIRLIMAETQLRSGQLEEAEAALQAIIAGVQKEAGDVSPHTVIAHRLRADIYAAQGHKKQAVQAMHEAWQSSLRVARRLSQIGAKNHFLHLHRALPMRYARAVLETGDALGAAAVLDEHLYEGGSQMRALSTLRTNPELWKPVKEARAALAKVRKTDCDMLSPDQRVACVGRVKPAQQDVLAAELSFYAKLQTPRRPDPKAALAQRRAQLHKGEGLLLSAGDGEDLQAFLLTKKDIIAAQGKAALSTLAPHIEKLSLLQVAGPLDPWAQISPEGQPWAARLPMYSSQYGRIPAAGTGKFSAPPLLVADPGHNLLKTAKRIPHWQERFGVTALKREAATRAAVLRQLKQRPSLFFFSGHSEYDDLDQSSTRIILSESQIDLQDVLADRLAARLVVLNGCSTGASQAGYGAGLPEAFILQGTEAVLGTTRVLKDGQAEAFLDRFFDAAAAQPPIFAMREAVRASVKAKDDSWKSLRLWR